MNRTAPHQMTGPVPGLHALQEAVWPQAHHPVRALVLKTFGEVAILPLARGLRFEAGGEVRLNTAHNIFALGKWRAQAGLTDLRLVIEGEGRFTLTLTGELEGMGPDGIWKPPAPLTESQGLTLTKGAPLVLDLAAWLAGPALVLHLALTAEGPATLNALTWATSDAPRRLPHLALTITTFRREANARHAIDNFTGRPPMLEGFLDLLVIDNGQTLEPVDLPHIRVIPNRNLGGSGGFARGMAEARALGASHCLFMDDDASLDMDGLRRIWTFLAHATDPRTAVAGALMSAEFPSELWENGATFAGNFLALGRGLDLAVPGDLFFGEITSAHPRVNFYGGFWCYAFPLDHVTHAPFPFFVRGDDTSFCIANGFANVTLPGVLCHQDVDFTEKESSQTLYLDLRSNLIHLATLPHQGRALRRALTLPMRFFGRCMMQHQTDSLAALSQAVEDFLKGPAFVEAEPDLASRRASIAAARKVEVWRPKGEVPTPKGFINPHVVWQRRLMALSLNGILLPGFAWWGNRVVLTQRQRGIVRPCFGASDVWYVSTDGEKVMHIRQDKLLELRLGLRMLRALVRLALAWPRLKRDWEQGYARMTKAEWWAAQFAKR